MIREVLVARFGNFDPRAPTVAGHQSTATAVSQLLLY